MPTTSLTLTVSDLVFNQGEEIRTNSLKVAEAFNKQHKDVIRKLKNLECSDEFIERNFTLNEYKDGIGRKLPMFEMTKNGFMFLVMGFTGKKAAAIKEAYINAFDRMAEQLRTIVPAIPQQQNQLTTFSRLPNYYDSGWLPALYERCLVEHRWTYHIKFEVRSIGDKYSARFIFGVGGKGKTEPDFEQGGSFDICSGDYFVYRELEELWEQVRQVLKKYQAHSPF